MKVKKLLPINTMLLLLCGIIFSIPVFAQNSGQIEIAQKKARILRAINLLRSQQNISPIAVRNLQFTDKLEINTTVGGAINGMLHGIDEPFFYTALVVAWAADSTDDSGVGFATVNSDGRYRIANLPTGDYYVLALAENYVPKFYDNVLNFNEATQVPVMEGDEVEGIDFLMEKVPPGTGSISGVVTTESDDHPIASAVMNVWSSDNPFSFGSAESDGNGNYKITNLKSGAYYATAFADGFLPEFYENAEFIEDATLIKVEEPNETSNINFSLSEGGKISGLVVNEDGAGIENAYVEAVPTYVYTRPTDPDSTIINTFGYATTDENGNYTITGLRTDEYYVSVRAWDQFSHVFEWYDDVTAIEDATPVPVVTGEETSGIDFELAFQVLGGEIFGTVTDLEGQSIEGAFVHATLSEFDSTGYVVPTIVAITDKNGFYHIKNLAHGSYLVMVTVQNGWQYIQRWWPDAETPEEADPVIVDGATEPPPIDFRIPLTPATAVISGKVRSDTGEPLPYAFIELSSAKDPSGLADPGIWAYANSDSNGFYKIENLPAGTYIARAQFWQSENFGQQWYDHADDPENATPIVLADGETRSGIDFDLALRPFYGDIAGKVVDDASGQSIARAYVEINPVDYDPIMAPFYPWPYYAVTNENGDYKLERLPEGKYLVSVYANGAFEYFENAVVAEEATPVKITGGEVTTVDFGLTGRNEGSGLISGQVYDEYHDGFLEIAVVTAHPVATPLIYPDSELFYTAVIDENGHYKLTGLPEGEYFVFAFAPGYIGEYYDSVFDPAEATPVKVDSLNPATGIDFSLHPMIFFESRFTDGATPPQIGASIVGKVNDQNQNGLVNATVYLLNGNNQPVSFARTNAEGTYEITNIVPGKYRIRAGRQGYLSKYNGNVTEFDEAEALEAHNGVYEINFVLEPGPVTSVNNNPEPLPKTVQLYGNYPNPFNPTTQIFFSLPSEMQVKITIFNLLGQKIRDLHNSVLNAGTHQINWDGQNNAGHLVPSGIYFYVLQTNQKHFLAKKMTLLK